jgi:hypothetical protein
MASRSISFHKKEAMTSGLLHMAGPLIVTLTGPGAGNLDWRTIMDAIINTFRLGLDTVQEIYRNSSAPRWFFRLNGEAFAKHHNRLYWMPKLNKKTWSHTLHCSQREGEAPWISQLAFIDTDGEVCTADRHRRVRRHQRRSP